MAEIPANGLGAASVGLERKELVIGVCGFVRFTEVGGDAAEQVEGIRVVTDQFRRVLESGIGADIVSAVGIKLRDFDVFRFALVIGLQVGRFGELAADDVPG